MFTLDHPCAKSGKHFVAVQKRHIKDIADRTTGGREYTAHTIRDYLGVDLADAYHLYDFFVKEFGEDVFNPKA